MPVVSPSSAPRNPDWEEDELVLALDAYLSASRTTCRRTAQRSPS